MRKIRNPKSEIRPAATARQRGEKKTEVRNPKTAKRELFRNLRILSDTIRYQLFRVFRGSFGFSDFGFRIFTRRFQVFALVLWSQAVLGASDDERIPPLQPPRGPLPPDFWEQYGLWVVFGGVFAVLLVPLILWLVLRPKPPVMIPPEAEARSVLGALREQPETGNILSRVSHALRHYFSAAFGLAEGELTTAEFCRALEAAPEPGPQLKGKVTAFLRECDERKFSPAQVTASMGAVTQALNFIAEAEVRRAELRAQKQPDGSQSSSPPPYPPTRGLAVEEREKVTAPSNKSIS